MILCYFPHTVTGPNVGVQSFHVTNQPGSQWIEMDVSDQLLEVHVFLTQDRFVTILKQLLMA